MWRRLRIAIIFLVIIIVGVGVIKWWLPALLKKPSVVKLPPGVMQLGGVLKGGDVPIAVRTFKASRIQFTDLLPTMGTVRGQTESELKFEVNGVVKSINFREGDIVTRRQVLATLDDQDAKLRVEYADSKLKTAEARLDLARKRMSINEQLYQLGAIIKSKLEESQIEVKQAEAEVDTAQKELSLAESEFTKTSLKAPIDGVMGTREVDVGEYVTPQAVVATVIDMEEVFIELGIIERDIERIRLGQRVKISIDSLPSASFEGKIDNLAPLIEGKSRTLTAKVKVQNSQGQLLPGMFARSEIAVYEKPDALVVPTTALRDTNEDGKFESVFVLDGQAVHQKQIVLGYLTTDYAEIAGGLEEGEQVVTEARGELKDGSKVTLLEEEEAGVQRVEPKISIQATPK